MADSNKKMDEVNKSLKAINDQLKNTSKLEKQVLTDIEKRAKKATKATDDLGDSFKTFNKVLDGVSAHGITDTLKDMPNYIKGVSKLSTSFSKFSEEASNTSEMFKTMGISFNKTMKDLETKSGTVSKAMNNLMSKANKFATVKDNLASVPKQLKQIQDAMGSSPEIKLGSFETLEKMLDSIKGKVSDVDFDDIAGKLEKVGKGGASDALIKGIKDKLSKVKITSPIIGGEEIAKQAVDSITKELDNLSGINPGDALINSFLKDLEELGKDSTFSDVMKTYKSDIDDFKDTLKEPGATYEEVSAKMISLNDKLSDSMSGFFESFDSEASKLANAQKDITKGQEELSDKFRKGYHLTFFTDEAVAGFQGALSQISADAYSIQANNIIPDEQLLKADEMKSALRDLVAMQEENKELQQSLSSGRAEEAGALELTLKAQKDNEKSIKKQIRYMKDLEKSSSSYTKNVIEASEAGFGQKEAEGLGEKLFGISGKLGKMGNDMGEDSKMGKGLKGLGNLAGKFGGKLSKLSFPIGLITGAIAVTKTLLKIEDRYAKMSSEINNTGALMAASAANVGAAMDDLNMKASNLPGLMKAAAGGKEFALARGEILDVVNTLNEAGIPARNLKEQMAGVATTAEGAKNEFLGAANVVTTFSHNLGISKGAVAGMMGEMGHEFGATMGTLKDTFADITAGAAASNMSTNRFLATVQTATAGMSLYEDQVSSVAKMVGQLGKNTNLTGTDIATVAKNVTDFGRNTEGLILSMSAMSAEQKKSVIETVNAEKKALAAKLETMKEEGKGDSKEAKRLRAQIKLKGSFAKNLQEGKTYQAAGEAKFQSPEVIAKLMSVSIAKAMSAGESGGQAAMESIAKQFGIDPKVIESMVARGVSADDIAQELSKVVGDPEGLQKKALEIDKKTGNARNKLLSAAEETASILGGRIVPLLLGITALIAAGGGLKGIKDIFSGGKGGKGKGLIDTLTKKGGDFFKGGKGKAVGDIGRKGLDMVKGSGAAKGVGSVLKGGGKLIKGLGKAAGPIGAALSVGMGAYDTYDAINDPNKDKGDVGAAAGGAAGAAAGAWGGAAAGAAIGSVVPVIGTAIGGLIGAGIGAWLGGEGGAKLGEMAGDAIDKNIVPTVASPTKIDPSFLKEGALPGQGNQLRARPSITNNASSRNNTIGSKLSTATQSGTISNNNTITNHNNFNINGGDPEELKKIILDVLVKHEKQSS